MIVELDRAGLERELERAFRDVDVRSNVFERLLEAAGRILSRVLEATVLRGDLVGVLINVAILVAAIGLTFWLVRRGSGVVRAGDVNPDGDEGAEPDWRAIADTAMANGDLEAALRAEYRLLLTVLAGSGALRDAPSLTAAECRDRVQRRRPDLQQPVTLATTAFERVAYGDAEPTATDVDDVRRAQAAVRR